MKSMKTSNRQALSLRVPHALAEQVEAYAQKNNLRKTDAYIHFLEMGLERNDRDVVIALAEMDKKLDSLYSLLTNEEGDSVEISLGKQGALDAIAEVSSRFPGIERAWLFGSFARNQQTANSDIDIRLEVDREAGFNLHDLVSFTKMMEQETGRACDVITAREIQSKSLALAIEKDGVCAYERKEK